MSPGWPALLRAGGVPVAAHGVAVYCQRGSARTPMVTLALLIFFGFPLSDWPCSPLVAAIVIISINTSVFQAEIGGPRSWTSPGASSTPLVRAHDLPSRSGGSSFPQVWRASLPASRQRDEPGDQGSPAVAVIGVVDLTRVGRFAGRP